jgi:hypothetical protein
MCALVMECARPSELATFWSGVLGAELIESSESWASISAPSIGRISFQAVDGYEPPVWPGEAGQQQMHPDVLVGDLAGATERVVGLGATPLTEVLNPGPKGWRIFADPEGHPFCLVSVPE